MGKDYFYVFKRSEVVKIKEEKLKFLERKEKKSNLLF